MTTYYVRKTGNDGAAGTSPATAWLTIGKALGAAGISSGDTVYIGAGVYREKVTCALISPVAETFVIGDVNGSHTGDAGEIRITNYLTDDKTAPTNQSVLDLNGRNYLTFQTMTFQGLFIPEGPPQVNRALIDTSTPSQYIKFIDCAINLFALKYIGYAIYCTGAVDTPMHWLVDRCKFLLGNSDVRFWYINDVGHAADFDADVIVRNCQFIGGGGVAFKGSNTVGGFAGGMVVRNCFVYADSDTGIDTSATSLTYPVQVYNCLVWNMPGAYYALQANIAGELVSDYNHILASWSDTYSNVTPGGNDIADGSYAMLMHFGQELQQGLMLRPFGMPTADSPLLGFGDDGNAPSVDILNRPRPAGGQSTAGAVGAYERHDTAVKETIVFDVTPGIKIVGPGDHEFQIPVDATATTISVKARYDANHAATNKPQAILLAAPEIGVTTETETMTAAVDTWETLTFTQFTPTASGVVTVRLVSRSAADNGIAYFDTFNIS